MDPTPMVLAFPILQHRRELLRSYTRLAKVDSHRQFVSTCLRNHVIPRGLRINIKPSVPKSLCREPIVRLEKEWARIINRAAWGFLAALKRYHGSCARHLRLQVANLEASIARLGRRNALTTMNLCKTVYNTWNDRLRDRRKNKLNKLLTQEFRMKKAINQQKKKRRRRFTRKTTTDVTSNDPEQGSTVVNLSEVALSETEINLLSKGLSFCPIPCQ